MKSKTFGKLYTNKGNEWNNFKLNEGPMSLKKDFLPIVIIILVNVKK